MKSTCRPEVGSAGFIVALVQRLATAKSADSASYDDAGFIADSA